MLQSSAQSQFLPLRSPHSLSDYFSPRTENTVLNADDQYQKASPKPPSLNHWFFPCGTTAVGSLLACLPPHLLLCCSFSCCPGSLFKTQCFLLIFKIKSNVCIRFFKGIHYVFISASSSLPFPLQQQWLSCCFSDLSTPFLFKVLCCLFHLFLMVFLLCPLPQIFAWFTFPIIQISD